jgi:hypothetical protein
MKIAKIFTSCFLITRREETYMVECGRSAECLSQLLSDGY